MPKIKGATPEELLERKRRSARASSLAYYYRLSASKKAERNKKQREKRKQYSVKYYYSLTPEQRSERNKKSNELRRLRSKKLTDAEKKKRSMQTMMNTSADTIAKSAVKKNILRNFVKTIDKNLSAEEIKKAKKKYFAEYYAKNKEKILDHNAAYKKRISDMLEARKKILKAIHDELPESEIDSLKNDYFIKFKKRFKFNSHEKIKSGSIKVRKKINKDLIFQYENLFGEPFVFSSADETNEDIQKIIEAKIQANLEEAQRERFIEEKERMKKRSNLTYVRKIMPFIPLKPFETGDHVLLIDTEFNDTIMDGCVLEIDTFLEHLYPYVVKILLSDKTKIDVTRDGLIYDQDYHSRKLMYKGASADEGVANKNRKNII